VGRSYLTSRGVPGEAIIVENEGESTCNLPPWRERSCGGWAALGHRGERRIHIYRVKKMLQSRGLNVYGSPRKELNPPASRAVNYVKQPSDTCLARGMPV